MKSIGHEETFADDIADGERLADELVRLADGVASRVRAAGLAGRTVSIKVRFGDFQTISRSTTLDHHVDTGPEITGAAGALLAGVDCSPGVRLLGVYVSHLDGSPARQLRFDDLAAPSWGDATGAVDAVRARYGAAAIGPASVLRTARRNVKRTGDTQWGPSD